MKVERTRLPDVLVVESPVLRDDRGFFSEVHHAEKLAALGLPTMFAQDNHSRSRAHVIRGMHFQLQQPQGKLVRPITGAIFDVAVDIRRSSRTFGQWAGVTLEAGDGRQLWVPPGFAHGFLVLSDGADVLYKCTTTYHAASDRSLAWNDAAIGIEWPIPAGVSVVLSEKDARAPDLASAELFA